MCVCVFVCVCARVCVYVCVCAYLCVFVCVFLTYIIVCFCECNVRMSVCKEEISLSRLNSRPSNLTILIFVLNTTK